MAETATQPSDILTERLHLRAPVLSDAPAIHRCCEDLEVARWLAAVPHPYSEEDARTFLRLCQDGAFRNRAILLRGTGELAGMIGVSGDDVTPQFGYWLGRPYWGQGLMSEAARAVVDHAFRTEGAARLRSGIFEGNTASLRIQTRLGFRVIGARRVMNRALGRDLPHTDTALTRADWEARA